jgi:hypothetical protein
MWTFNLLKFFVCSGMWLPRYGACRLAPCKLPEWLLEPAHRHSQPALTMIKNRNGTPTARVFTDQTMAPAEQGWVLEALVHVSTRSADHC